MSKIKKTGKEIISHRISEDRQTVTIALKSKIPEGAMYSPVELMAVLYNRAYEDDWRYTQDEGRTNERK